MSETPLYLDQIKTIFSQHFQLAYEGVATQIGSAYGKAPYIAYIVAPSLQWIHEQLNVMSHTIRVEKTSVDTAGVYYISFSIE